MPTALGHRPDIDDQLDFGVADKLCEFVGGRSAVSEREEPRSGLPIRSRRRRYGRRHAISSRSDAAVG